MRTLAVTKRARDQGPQARAAAARPPLEVAEGHRLCSLSLVRVAERTAGGTWLAMRRELDRTLALNLCSASGVGPAWASR